MDKVFIIEFEDHGQDFLIWKVQVDTAMVVECTPFQGSVWCGNHVIDVEDLAPGDYVSYISRHQGEEMTIKYPVKSVGVGEIELKGGES